MDNLLEAVKAAIEPQTKGLIVSTLSAQGFVRMHVINLNHAELAYVDKVNSSVVSEIVLKGAPEIKMDGENTKSPSPLHVVKPERS